MAKKDKAAKGTTESQLVIPDFVDVDAASVTAAMANLSAGAGWSIPEPPLSKRGNDDKKGGKHWRWSEEVTITQAYRTVSKNGLLDVVIVVKSRPGFPNEGKTEFLHLYINAAVMQGKGTEEQKKNHTKMTSDSLGVIGTLIIAANLMPDSGAFKASMLSLLFPAKGDPGKKSPLDGKTVIVNAHGQVKVEEITTVNNITGEVTKEKREDPRISPDSFLPAPVGKDEDDDEEEEEEDAETEEDSDDDDDDEE